jgi:hypothetical protein
MTFPAFLDNPLLSSLLCPGQLSLLSGPAKSGRTQLALALATHWSKQNPVSFVSEEDSKAELVSRLLLYGASGMAVQFVTLQDEGLWALPSLLSSLGDKEHVPDLVVDAAVIQNLDLVRLLRDYAADRSRRVLVTASSNELHYDAGTHLMMDKQGQSLVVLFTRYAVRPAPLSIEGLWPAALGAENEEQPTEQPTLKDLIVAELKKPGHEDGLGCDAMSRNLGRRLGAVREALHEMVAEGVLVLSLGLRRLVLYRIATRDEQKREEKTP